MDSNITENAELKPTESRPRRVSRPRPRRVPAKKSVEDTVVSTENNVNIEATSTTDKKYKKPRTPRYSGSKVAPGLKISFLGGVGEIGKNMIAVEYGNDMIVIDAGLTFPSDDMPGIDLIIPDANYLVQNKDRIKGIIVTHGHEDHIGAIPYLLQNVNVPIYATRLTCALIENKLKEHKKIKAKLISIKPKQVLKLGVFSIEVIKVTHSIGGAVGFAITTPAGTYFHTGDFKLDYTPIDNEVMDLARLSELGKKGVLLLTADSTNAERPGFSISEAKVGKTLDNIFSQNKQKRIIVATFASNIYRVQQLLNIAEKYGRKVAFSGRSMINVCETASKLGDLKFNKGNIIDITRVDKYPDNEICILSTGTQGEARSALTRMAEGDFNKIEIGDNDLIILSSSAIPGNEKAINNVINLLYKKGAEVIYESLAEVHTSGHANQEELKTIHALLKPKFFMPVHGEFRHLKAHANIAEAMGMPKQNILIPDLGDQITITKNTLQKTGVVPFGSLLIDGVGVSEVGSTILRDRMQLSEEGVCVVVISISIMTGALTSKPDIISRGFIYKNSDELDVIEEAKNIVINTISQTDFKSQDWGLIKSNIRKNLTTFFAREIKCRPLVIPVILETK
ncbi:MAG: ribonuclease J [Eubacteriales bacterium]|nr:ribonuclease J [Eubacteriales bacterium]